MEDACVNIDWLDACCLLILGLNMPILVFISSVLSGAILGAMTAFNSKIGVDLFGAVEHSWIVFWTFSFCVFGALSGCFTGLVATGFFNDK